MDEQDEQCFIPGSRAQSQKQRERFVTVNKTQQCAGKGAFLLQLQLYLCGDPSQTLGSGDPDEGVGTTSRGL